jgi:hypothetical protein
MEREEAKVGLQSDAPNTRLLAARFYSKNALRGDFIELRKARKKETVPWIKRALDQALERVSAGPEIAKIADAIASEQELPKYVMRQIRAEAVAEVAGTIMHEFATLVGIVKAQAKEEVPDYLKSETHRALVLLCQKLQENQYYQWVMGTHSA